MFIYKKLEVWQLAKNLALEVYKITKKFPLEEKFGLASQLNRAAVSVVSNIAEGTSRRSYKEQAHFTEIAYGSLMEVTCQLQISKELGFVSDDSYKEMYKDLEILARRLSSLRSSQLKRYKNNNI